jgi:HSP20 family protein
MANNVATQENRNVQNVREATAQGPEQQREQRWLHPQVNIVETKEGYLLEAEMPAVGKEGLEVLLEGNELTILGRRTHKFDGARLVYRESHDRDFRRSFELDPTIDTERIAARMEDGVLYLTLPKAEKVKPRKINIE